MREQFINLCPGDLSIHLGERAPKNLEEVAKIAEQFLIAYGRQLSTLNKPNKGEQYSKKNGKPGNQKENKAEQGKQCFNCRGHCHKAVECRKTNKSDSRIEGRFLSDGIGHLVKNCKSVDNKNGPFKAGVARNTCVENLTEEDLGLESCIRNDQLPLMNGKKLPIIKSSGVTMPGGVECQMPVVKGKVGNTIIDILRDTGCSRVVIRKDLVRSYQYTGKHGSMLLIDNTVGQVPIVKIHVGTPYLKGEVEAQCLPNAIYDLVIGNVKGARAPDDPVPTWHEGCDVTRRAQSKRSGELKSLKTLETSKGKLIG